MPLMPARAPTNKEADLNAINHGVAVTPQSANGRRSLAAAVTDFLDETKLTKKPKTFASRIQVPPRYSFSHLCNDFRLI